MELPITKDQAQYLNTVARLAHKYRMTNEGMQKDLSDNLDRANKGFLPAPVRHQDAAEILMLAGQLDALGSVLYSVFPFPVEPTDSVEAMDVGKAHETMVNGYFKSAMMLGDSFIFMKH